MTYSIIARCPRTGRFGVGSTTFSMACGRRNESVRPNVGVSKSQAFYLRYVDPLALNMLAQGYTPQHIVRKLRPTIRISIIASSASSTARTTWSRIPGRDATDGPDTRSVRTTRPTETGSPDRKRWQESSPAS